MYNTLKSKVLSLDTHTKEVAKKSAASLLVKVFGMAAAFITSVILGRTLGAEGLGIISLSNQIIGIVLIFSMFGTYNVILKQTAIGFEKGDNSQIADAMNTATVINLPLSVLFTILMVALTPWLALNVFKDAQLITPFYIAAAFIIPQTLIQIHSAGINGLRKIWQSNLLHQSLSAILVILGLLILMLFEYSFSVIKVILIYAISRIIVLIVVRGYWKSIFSYKGERKLFVRRMFSSSMPLLIVSSSVMLSSNADSIMLGWLSNVEEVGLYSVAVRLALLTSLFHALTTSVLSSKVAGLYNEKKVQEIQLMISRVTKMLFIIGLLSCLLFIVFGRSILTIWGTEFQLAYWPLVVLSITQLVKLGTGATDVILIMTGNERRIGFITFSFALLNIGLNYMLIPEYGAIGAAFATGSAIVLESLTKVFVVKIRTGISTISLFNKNR